MYVKLKCLIEIKTAAGTVKFDAVNAVEIDRSIDRVGSTAKVRIPTSARLVYSDRQTESVQTEKMFRRGDKITVQLGYGDRLREEFAGFISALNYTTPFEFECEGFEYLLRGNVKTKTFAATNLKNVLQYIIAGTGIKLDGQIPELKMTNYVIPAKLTGVNALQQLKEKYGITVYFAADTLYAGLDFLKNSGRVKYAIGVNTIKSGELKYRDADDVKIKIKAVGVQKNNTKIEAEVGDRDGQVRTLHFYNVKSKTALETLAKAELSNLKYTGYSGRISAFLEPPATPGMIAELSDPKYPDRGGKYEIRSVKTSFGTGGARRSVEIGKAVSDSIKN